jgi:hypothetical protein
MEQEGERTMNDGADSTASSCRDEAEALEREVAEEDFRLRMRLGGYAAMVAVGGLFLLSPMLAGLGLGRVWPVIVWTLVEAPLLVAAFLVRRQGRLPVGRGRRLEGRQAWLAVAGLLAVSSFLIFGRSVIQWVFELVSSHRW